MPADDGGRITIPGTVNGHPDTTSVAGLVGRAAHGGAGDRDRQRTAEASERRMVLTKTLGGLADGRGKPLQAFYASAIPLDLLRTDQDRISVAGTAAKAELDATEGDLERWQDVLRTAIRLAGNCHTAYMKARPRYDVGSTARCSRSTSRTDVSPGRSSPPRSSLARVGISA